MSEIIIQDYSPQWPLAFEKLKSAYQIALGLLIADVQHEGSTSVVGLAAKPVIDIDIIIPDNECLPQVVVKLGELGYKHRGDLGIAGREAFTLIANVHQWPKHNLYVCMADSISLKNHLALRDWLRCHPESVREYSELKKQLAIKYAHNIDLYVEGKTAFITDILRRAGFNETALQEITNANKAKL
ncbi:MAG TPA: GrpB family protein [Chitinophagales bacterium]|nr:GrpB family protein [Chitinophagales bacterium]